jgi:hypothetical protein
MPPGSTRYCVDTPRSGATVYVVPTTSVTRMFDIVGRPVPVSML